MSRCVHALVFADKPILMLYLILLLSRHLDYMIPQEVIAQWPYEL